MVSMSLAESSEPIPGPAVHVGESIVYGHLQHLNLINRHLERTLLLYLTGVSFKDRIPVDGGSQASREFLLLRVCGEVLRALLWV